MSSFRGRDLLSMRDLTGEEIIEILTFARELKRRQKAGEPHALCRGKTLAMIFAKASTRTRVSFEVAMWQLGGYALYLSSQDLQLGRGETIADTARVLSRYVDGIMVRTFAQADVEEMARYADVPVINGLTDHEHPCQILADLLTILERKGTLAGLRLAFVGDGNNIVHSLLLGCARVGMDIAVATPPGYEPHPEVVATARADAAAAGGAVEIGEDPAEAVAGADVVVTDVWTSMGQEAERARRLVDFAPYQVNGRLVEQAKPDFIFLHCLPAHRGEEVTAEVIDGPHSAVWDEAENRLHVQKAILAMFL
ncbi:MAG: ornithine carbamoyltransferase [Desulfotomaculales bacterium]